MTISSKLYTSRIVVSGGGGGLILDLTPDFWVTLEKKEVRDRAQHQKNVQSHKTIQVSTALIFFMFSGSTKPLQSYSKIFIRWPHKTCFENDNERTRESFDIVFVAQGLSDTISVDFCDYNLVLCVWECICKLLIYRRQVLKWDFMSLRNMFEQCYAHFAVSTEQNSECQVYIRLVNTCGAPPWSEAWNWNVNQRMTTTFPTN